MNILCKKRLEIMFNRKWFAVGVGIKSSTYARGMFVTLWLGPVTVCIKFGEYAKYGN